MTAFSFLNNVDCVCVQVCLETAHAGMKMTCIVAGRAGGRVIQIGVVLWPPAGADGRKQL